LTKNKREPPCPSTTANTPFILFLSQSAHSSSAPIKATRRCTSICPAVAPFSQIFPFPHQIFPLTPEHPLKQQMPAIPYFPHRQLREK